MLLVRHPFEKRKAMASKLPRVQSEPAVHLYPNKMIQNNNNKRDLERKRRKSTVLYPSSYYNPRMVLELILSQPCHAYIGIGPSLRRLIELTIHDLQLQDSLNDYSDSEDSENIANIRIRNRELVDEGLLRLEIDEFKSFVPLQASIQNFEMILDQKYTFTLICAVIHALIGSFLAGYNTSLLNVPSLLTE
eukprot:58592_1